MALDISNFRQTLDQKLNTFDKEGSGLLCNELISFLYSAKGEFSVKEGEKVLGALRNKRMFELMQKVGDALIQSGRDSFKVRKLYAQSLIDQGYYTAALEVLNQLIEDTNRSGESQEIKEENFEAKGLRGRIYKQLYLNAVTMSNQKNVEFIRKAISSYLDVYNETKEKVWHGINAAALINRAKRDGIDTSEFSETDQMAMEILETIKDRDDYKKADTFDFATALEACIATGRTDEALQWLKKYINGDYADAFELASTLRQLTEVWQLNMDSEIGKMVLPILRSQLLKREGGQVLIDTNDLKVQKESQASNDSRLERVFGDESFRTYSWYMLGADRCLAVARIGTDISKGYGTGFLLEGSELHEKLKGELVLLTNAHVVSDNPSELSLRSNQAIIIFEILNNLYNRKEQFKISEIIWNSPSSELDVTIIRFKPEDMPRLKELTKNINLYPVSDDPKPLEEINSPERIYVIGHPAGGTLQLSFVDNTLLGFLDPRIHYRTPTEPGSSGSPVFNDNWELIGIHHAGGNSLLKLHGEGTYQANEGIWIHSVKKKLAEVLS